MIDYFQIKQKVIKLNAYYVFNQGEYMNNYKFSNNQQLDNDEIIILIDKIKNIVINKSIFELSNFEFGEINKVKEILLEKSEMKNNLNEVDEIIDFEKFAFEENEILNYESIRKNLHNEMQALNFSLKSLSLQKKYMLDNFELTNAIKISDEINEILSKIEKIKNEIMKINSEILENELSFFEEYVQLLNDISENKLILNNKTKLPKNYNERVINYLKINKVVFYIILFKDKVSIDELIEIIANENTFKEFFGDVFETIIYVLRNVGTNI